MNDNVKELGESQKDIFQLSREQKELREYRISQVLCGDCPRGSETDVRAFIADQLYHAKWDSKLHDEAIDMPLADILEAFCWNIFGASLEETLIAWDRYLG